MTPKLTDRLARLEQAQQAAEANREPMSPTLYEWALRTVSERFGDYPNGAADTLADGLARALGYTDRVEAGAAAEADREIFDARIDALWPRLVEQYDSPQHGPETTGDNRAFRIWAGILEGSRHYRSDEKPTADLRYLPNGLPLFDYTVPIVKAAFEFFGTTAEAVEEIHDERARTQQAARGLGGESGFDCHPIHA
jgi:hypothetical protein